MNKIILASKSKVRKNILENNGIFCEVQPSNVDEEPVKESLIKEGASPEIVSKNLGELIENFSKILKKQSLNIPSRQHKLNEEYYERVEAIQFTMRHDDGNDVKDIEDSDIILLGVSRTSKTPTSIYLANRGYKTSNIPLVNENSIPEKIKKNRKKICVVGLTTDPERLIDLRKNRLRSLKENEKTDYTNLKKISEEVKAARKTFKKYKWPVIDVTRKSVEETAASIIKIHEINSRNE